MAYVEIPDALIEIGEATKKEIFQGIKDNQESFNTDIEALKQTSTVDVFDVRFEGEFGAYSSVELEQFYPIFKAPVGVTMNSFVVTLLEASTSGTLEIGIEKSIDNGVNWTPLLSSPVQVTGAAVGSVSGAVNWVDVPSQSVNQNELLRITIETLQVDQGSFHVSVYGEVS
jgi:hypothetical protein